MVKNKGSWGGQLCNYGNNMKRKPDAERKTAKKTFSLDTSLDEILNH